MGKYKDPFEEFKKKKEMEKIKKKHKDEEEAKKEEKSDTEKFDGFHISTFFNKGDKKKKDDPKE